MHSSIFSYLVAFFFIAACAQLPSVNPNSAPGDKQPEKGQKEIVPPQGIIKDTTAFPPLVGTLPDLAKTEGWSLVLSTPGASIPSAKPVPSRDFFIAKKIIDGQERAISVAFGDLLQESDTIVNAANSGLEGGGGIDGAIHNAAKVNGKDLLVDEAKAYKTLHKISSFPIGSAMVMNPYGLGPAIKMIIFTVGPQGDSTPAKDLELYSAVYNSLLKASEYGAKSISIPTISTGIYAFPLERAAELYFGAALQFFVDNPKTSINLVRFMDLAQDKIQRLGARFDILFP